jgi:carboxymethylenebutenolidase
MSSVDRIMVGTSPMEIHVARPQGTAPCPAILLMYHRGGVDDFTRWLMQGFVDAGYLIAVPDVSHRVDPQIPMTNRKAHLVDSQIVADIEATLVYLQARPDVDTDRIAIVGHCMGGRMAMLGAGLVHAFAACIVYYGGGMMVSWNETVPPFEYLKDIACPVQGFYANLDTNPPPADVNRIEAELVRCGIPHEIHRYDDIGHGFQNPAHEEAPYRAAAKDSWNKMIRFLDERLATARADA